MIKYIRTHLSAQVLILTLLIQVSISLVTYFFIIAAAPKTYLDKINQGTDSMLKETASKFSGMAFQECKRQLLELSKRYGIMVKLTDAAGAEIEFGSDMQFGADGKDAGWSMRENVGEAYMFIPEDRSSPYYIYAVSSGERVELYKNVLKEILPCLLVLVLTVSLVFSLLCTRHVSDPVRRISGLAEKLAELKFVHYADTGRKDELGKIEESLYNLSDHLALALHELECANQNLRKEVEKEKNMEKQQLSFFSAASHELKTPITALKGHLQGMLCNVGGYRDHRKYLERCLFIVENMQKLEREIMSSAEIRSSGFTMDISRFDLREITVEAIGEYEDIAMHKGIAIQEELGIEEAHIEGDRNLLKRALSNVISNAIRYSPDNETVEVRLETAETVTCLKVRNQGEPIPEGQIQKMFLPFMRLEESRNKETGGSGVGLYLVKMILDLHGAPYQLCNTGMGGIEFKITFNRISA